MSPRIRELINILSLSVSLLLLSPPCVFVAVQTELNSREGAWERLSRERDPLVLSSLMWSWLEQLKEPVISSEDIKALSERNVSRQSSLDSLEKVTG